MPAEIATFDSVGASGSLSASLSLPAAGSADVSSNQLLLAAALSSVGKSSADVLLSRRIPSLPKKLAEKILNWEFVDFNELPLACSLFKSSHTPRPNILLVQLADSIQGHKKIMTDIHVQTRMQCFSVYTSVLGPQYIPELLAYPHDIMRVSRQFKWPSWVIYDTNYLRHTADIGQRDWSKVGPSIYARCFTGWAQSTSWCSICITLDHN